MKAILIEEDTLLTLNGGEVLWIDDASPKDLGGKWYDAALMLISTSPNVPDQRLFTGTADECRRILKEVAQFFFGRGGGSLWTITYSEGTPMDAIDQSINNRKRKEP